MSCWHSLVFAWAHVGAPSVAAWAPRGVVPRALGSLAPMAGKKLVDFMLDPTTKRKFGLELVKTENQATALANRLLNHQPPLFIPVERLKVRRGVRTWWCVAYPCLTA